jgi:prepilin-type N-terminal cleavage/methylation domain-containing protein
MDTRHFRRADRGFTLLEIVIAVTLLATFLLPMLLIISQSKIRAIRYTMQRQVRDLAQRKLFDRVHYYETNDQGDFTLEGHSDWHWEIEPPQMIGSGEQVLLQYNIRVTLPQKLEGDPSATSQDGTEGSTYQMSLWTFPDSYWYEEQQLLYEQGGYSSLYGSRSMSGGSY